MGYLIRHSFAAGSLRTVLRPLSAGESLFLNKALKKLPVIVVRYLERGTRKSFICPLEMTRSYGNAMCVDFVQWGRQGNQSAGVNEVFVVCAFNVKFDG